MDYVEFLSSLCILGCRRLSFLLPLLIGLALHIDRFP